jgi:hypothetical protein
MSRRKRGQPKIITNDGSPPQQAVFGTRPGALEEARERWREEGRRALQQDVDAKIDQARADATALETAAKIVDAAWDRDLPFPNPREVARGLRAMAGGMRIAADRLPHTDDCPF